MNNPVKYKAENGRTIEIYSDRKIRSGYFGDNKDQWPVLYRNTVPNLTDAEWYSPPDSGWFEVK